MSGRLGWRPLLGGVGILPSSTNRWATAGLYFTSGGSEWLLTALHVLGDLDASPMLQVWQGPRRGPAWLIADTAVHRVVRKPAVDAAAIPLLPTLTTTREFACLGPWGWPARAPVVGERVAKVGSATGVSVGEVSSVAGGQVTIQRYDYYPGDYRLSEAGDSGAVWMALDDYAPLALHQGEHVQSGRAIATSLVAVFATLQLNPTR